MVGKISMTGFCVTSVRDIPLEVLVDRFCAALESVTDHPREHFVDVARRSPLH